MRVSSPRTTDGGEERGRVAFACLWLQGAVHLLLNRLSLCALVVDIELAQSVIADFGDLFAGKAVRFGNTTERLPCQ